MILLSAKRFTNNGYEKQYSEYLINLNSIDWIHATTREMRIDGQAFELSPTGLIRLKEIMGIVPESR